MWGITIIELVCRHNNAFAKRKICMVLFVKQEYSFLLSISFGTIRSEVKWELVLQAVTLLYQKSKSDLGISLVCNIICGSDSGEEEQNRESRRFCTTSKATPQ